MHLSGAQCAVLNRGYTDRPMFTDRFVGSQKPPGSRIDLCFRGDVSKANAIKDEWAFVWDDALRANIAYALQEGSKLGPMFGRLEVEAPDVAIDRKPAIVIKAPVKGEGWLVSNGCCKPNLHRDLRVAIDGVRIETPETFSIDYAKIKNNRIYHGSELGLTAINGLQVL